jgi:hypothetical protein
MTDENLKNNDFIIYVEGIIKKYKRDNAHLIFGEIMAYIREYCKLDDEYYIMGSYVMGIKNIKQISNISVSVTPKNMGLILKNIKKFGKLETLETSNGVIIKFLIDLTKFFTYNKEYRDYRKNFFIELFQYPPESGFPTENFSYNSMKENNGILKDLFKNYYMSLNKLLEWKKELVTRNLDSSKHIKDIDDINKSLQLKYIKYKNKYILLKKNIYKE